MDLSLIWIPATLTAAAAQTARNVMQHRLTESLGTIGATQVRFLYGLPFAILFLGLLTAATGEAVPRQPPSFFLWAFAGGVTQIAATALMLAAMSTQAFGTVIAYTKSEPVQVAMFGLVFLGDRLTVLGTAAIAVATFGVVVLSRKGGHRTGQGFARLAPAAMGIGAGAGFAMAAICFRGAIMTLPEASFVMRATTTLVWALAIQTGVLLAWLLIADRGALTRSLGVWRSSLLAGFLGALASQFWFIGFATTTAANVRTLALIEVVFAALISRRLFAQTVSWREWTGYALVCGGVALLILGAA